MKLTSKLDFRLTKARFKMLSTSGSKFRSIPKALLVIPILSVITFMFCSDIYDGHPNEIYRDGENLTLVFENKSPRGSHWATYLDSESNPYSGEVNWYFKANDQLSRKEVYDNGKLVRVDVFDIEGKWVWLSKNEISEDENGIKYLESYQKTENDSIYLAFDLVWDGNSHIVQEYYLNGQLRHQYTYNTLVNRVNGMAYQYDEEGNIIKQERYENGILIETIK